MKKTMDFILEQQAQTTATMGRLTEAVERLSLKVDRNADGVAGLLAIAGIHGGQMKETDDRLNALINTAERHISGGRSGKA